MKTFKELLEYVVTHDFSTKEEYHTFMESEDVSKLTQEELAELQGKTLVQILERNNKIIDYDSLPVDEKLDYIFEDASEIKTLDEDVKRKLVNGGN